MRKKQIIYRTIEIEDDLINEWLRKMSNIKSFKPINICQVRGDYKFNLSEKIENIGRKDFSVFGFDSMIRTEEVKEFIRLLRYKMPQGYYEEVLKLAGDKLK